jgi:hypothetical protein
VSLEPTISCSLLHPLHTLSFNTSVSLGVACVTVTYVCSYMNRYFEIMMKEGGMDGEGMGESIISLLTSFVSFC